MPHYVSPLFGRTKPRFNKGMVGYARLVLTIMRGARSAADIERAHGLNAARAMEFMLRLRNRGLARVDRWQLSTTRRGTPIAFFMWGESADATLPPRFDGTVRQPPRGFGRRLPIRTEQLSFMLVLEELKRGATMDQIMAATGLHRDALKGLMDTLRAGRALYVNRWDRGANKHPVKVFGLCSPIEPRADAPRPPPIYAKNRRPIPSNKGFPLDTNIVMVA